MTEVENNQSISANQLEMRSPADAKGNFPAVYTAVETAIRQILNERGLSIPVVPSALLGTWQFDGEYFQATSSALIVITSPQVEGEYVLKLLREPNYRLAESSGPIWSNEAGHLLFPWSGVNDDDLETGIAFQHDSLMGELSRGTLFNPENSPYQGLVAAQQLDHKTVTLKPIEEMSATEYAFPALLMKKVPVVASVANVIMEWPDKWPEFTAEDIERLCAASALAFDRGSIQAPAILQQQYGTATFFKHCLTQETPYQAAQMGTWPQYKDNPVIVKAAHYAGEIVEIFEKFIEENTRRLNGVGSTVVIGHADTKPNNAAIAANTRDEVVAMVKNPEQLKFVLLDAQSLAVKAATLHGTEEGGVYYAHWPFVPRVQQLAYNLKSLLALKLDRIHDRALDIVLQTAFDTSFEDWYPWMKAFYYLQVAYKMGGVEPLVNADNYNARTPEELKRDSRSRLVMETYPPKALELAQRALDLARQTG